MKPDFAAVREGRLTYADAVRDLDRDGLRALTDDLYDEVGAIVAPATDADVIFEPVDPDANDTFGASEEANLAWTLAHVVVHLTASAEESAALASQLARGIPVQQGEAGRSRHETPWETVTTAAQVQERLAESRRICRAFRDAWPDRPHLDVTYTAIPRLGPLNAVGRYTLGLFHGDSHLGQLREIMRQAKEAGAASGRVGR